MGGMLVAARLLLALVEREAGHRARRAAGMASALLAGLFVGLAGLLFVLYALVLALTPYLTPAGAAAIVGAAMILVAAILVSVTFRRPKATAAPINPIQPAVAAAAAVAGDLGQVVGSAGRKLGETIQSKKPSAVTVALAALIAGLVAGRKI